MYALGRRRAIKPKGEMNMANETKAAEVESNDEPKKDEFYGSAIQKGFIEEAVKAGHIKLSPCSKTQKTRGKGSRELTYNWNDIEFVDSEGVLAYVGNDESRLLALMSEVASDNNKQLAWEALFEISDEDKLIRRAAMNLAKVLGVDEEAAEKIIREQVEAKRKGV